jgi:LAO/AO transport system kinase
VRVLDACGKDLIVIETVGVGQAEVEITDACDTTIVVLNPGWGDAVQAAKAGLMEIADVFVVNKADRQGTRETVRELKQMLDLSEAGRKPAIVQTVATKGEGIDELWEAIEEHRSYQEVEGLLAKRRRRRIEREIREIVAARFRERVEEKTGSSIGDLAAAVERRELDPYAAADSLIAELQN